jgi:hypothetical protein
VPVFEKQSKKIKTVDVESPDRPWVSGFMVTVFFLGFAISPLWTATMDIAPDYAGTSSSLMNASGAVAGIVSPGRLRLDPRPHRQLDAAVRGLGRAAAVRHRHDLLDPAGSSDQGRSQPLIA